MVVVRVEVFEHFDRGIIQSCWELRLGKKCFDLFAWSESESDLFSNFKIRTLSWGWSVKVVDLPVAYPWQNPHMFDLFTLAKKVCQQRMHAQTHISEKSTICMIMKPFTITIHVVQHYTSLKQAFSPALMKPRTQRRWPEVMRWGGEEQETWGPARWQSKSLHAYQTIRLSQVTTSSPPNSKGIILVMLLGWLRQLACWTQHQRRSTHKVNPPAN